MKTIVIGSTNPVKVAAVEAAFTQVFPHEPFSLVPYSAPSLVPDQPIGDSETKTGAYNRATACLAAYPEADYAVGLEGGLEKVADEYWASAWMCVRDHTGQTSFGRTGAFRLPPPLGALIDAGMELGTATDIVFNETNSKHKGSVVAILTNNLITRQDFYRAALVFALIPFMQPELYSVDVDSPAV